MPAVRTINEASATSICASIFFRRRHYVLVFHLLAHAALAFDAGQQYQVLAGEGKACRDARALGADGLLGHLHQQFLAGLQAVFHADVEALIGRRPRGDTAARAAPLQLLLLEGLRDERLHVDVVEVEEGVLLQADIHESGFDAWDDAFDDAFVNVADLVLVVALFHEQLDEVVVFEKGDTRFVLARCSMRLRFFIE